MTLKAIVNGQTVLQGIKYVVSPEGFQRAYNAIQTLFPGSIVQWDKEAE